MHYKLCVLIHDPLDYVAASYTCDTIISRWDEAASYLHMWMWYINTGVTCYLVQGGNLDSYREITHWTCLVHSSGVTTLHDYKERVLGHTHLVSEWEFWPSCQATRAYNKQCEKGGWSDRTLHRSHREARDNGVEEPTSVGWELAQTISAPTWEHKNISAMDRS